MHAKLLKIKTSSRSVSQLGKNKNIVFIATNNHCQFYLDEMEVANFEFNEAIKDVKIADNLMHALITTTNKSFLVNIHQSNKIVQEAQVATIAKLQNQLSYLTISKENQLSVYTIKTLQLTVQFQLNKHFNHSTISVVNNKIIGLGYYKGEYYDSIYQYKLPTKSKKEPLNINFIDSAEVLKYGLSDTNDLVFYRTPKEDENNCNKEDYEEDKLLGIAGIYKLDKKSVPFIQWSTAELGVQTSLFEICNQLIYLNQHNELNVVDWTKEKIKTISNVQAFNVDFFQKEIIYLSNKSIYLISLKEFCPIIVPK